MEPSDLREFALLLKNWRESRGGPEESEELLNWVEAHPDLEELLGTLAD